MPLTLARAPAIEPVTLSEAKAHCRIDGAADDAVLASLVTTSRLHIEAALGLALVTQGWRLVRDAWPARDGVRLPLRPVSAVTAVRVADDTGTFAIVDPTLWRLLRADDGEVQLLSAAAPWPQPGVASGGIEITFDAGFGDTAEAVPAPIRQALLMLIAHWYENREPARVGSARTRTPGAVSDLLAPYTRVRL